MRRRLSFISHRFYLLLIIISTVFLLALYSTQYDPMAPFSVFNPKIRQSEKPALIGYLRSDSQNQSIDNDFIYILGWTTIFDKPWPERIIENCYSEPKARCKLVRDRTFVDRSAAVVFHARDIAHTDLPSIKYRYQKYVFYSAESPVLTFAALQGASSYFFDWSMSYRTDSQIFCPYHYFVPLAEIDVATKNSNNTDWGESELENNNDWTTPLEKRPKIAFWIVSNCDTHSKRERYVHELKKYVQVDIFGDCGQPCRRNETYDCIRDLIKEYKFYISFENAVCRDYISEKFGYRMASNLVPIVLRREDYDRIVPHDSSSNQSSQHSSGEQNRSRYFFIAADDFNSPKDLADYLLFLDQHPKEYLKFFDWRKKWRIVSGGNRYCYCDMCSKLYQDRERWRRVVATENASTIESMTSREENSSFDIHQWWNVNTCDRGMALKLLDPARRVENNG